MNCTAAKVHRASEQGSPLEVIPGRFIIILSRPGAGRHSFTMTGPDKEKIDTSIEDRRCPAWALSGAGANRARGRGLHLPGRRPSARRTPLRAEGGRI